MICSQEGMKIQRSENIVKKKLGESKSFFFTTQDTVVNVPEVIFVCGISRFRNRGLFCVKYLTLFGCTWTTLSFKGSTFFCGHTKHWCKTRKTTNAVKAKLWKSLLSFVTFKDFLSLCFASVKTAQLFSIKVAINGAKEMLYCVL